MPTPYDRDENFYRFSKALARRRRPAQQGFGQQPATPAGEEAPAAQAPQALGGIPQQPFAPTAAPTPEAGSFLQFVSPEQQASVQPQGTPTFDLSQGFQNLGLAEGDLRAPVTGAGGGPLTGTWDPSTIPGGAMQTRGGGPLGSIFEDADDGGSLGDVIEDAGDGDGGYLTGLLDDLLAQAAAAEAAREAAAAEAAAEEEAARLELEGTKQRADEFMGDITDRFGEESFDPIEEGIIRQRDEAARMLAEMMAGRGMAASGVQAGLAGDIYQKGWQDVAQARSLWERQQTDQMMQAASLMFGDKWRALDRQQQMDVIQKLMENEQLQAQFYDAMASGKPGQLEALGNDIWRSLDIFNIGFGGWFD